MSSRTSSLRFRHEVLAAGACVFALACPVGAFAAGGTPMPAPDAPPSDVALATTKPSATKSTSSTPAPANRKAASTPSVPTPDPPLAAASSHQDELDGDEEHPFALAGCVAGNLLFGLATSGAGAQVVHRLHVADPVHPVVHRGSSDA